jgi:hypothetical protein
VEDRPADLRPPLRGFRGVVPAGEVVLPDQPVDAGATGDVTRPMGRSGPVQGTKTVAWPSPWENSSVA